MKDVKKTAAAKTEEVKETAQAATEETVKAAEETKKAAPKAVKKAASSTAKTVKKAAANVKKASDTAVKTAAKATKKAAVKKTVKKAAEVKETISLQYFGKDIKTADLMDQVKKIWTDELGKDAADLKTVNLYLKPEDNAAYYVINDSFTGRIDF